MTHAGRSWLAVLHPSSWPEAERTCVRQLCGHPDSPWLGLVSAGPLGTDYIRADPQEVATREREAIHRLRTRSLRPCWEPDGDEPVLRREGDDLTASDILDANTLREAASRLRAEPIHVAIPSRHQMVAGADPVVVKRVCLALHGAAPADSALSRLVFEVRDGQIAGAGGNPRRTTRRTVRPPTPTTNRRPIDLAAQKTTRERHLAHGRDALLLAGLTLLGLAVALALVRGRGEPAPPPPPASVHPALQPAPGQPL